MNWQKQAQDLIQSWTSSQEQIWQTWQNSLQAGGAKGPGELWTQAVSTWEHAMGNAWDAQAKMMEMWRSSADKIPGDLPPEVKQQTQQMQELMESWTQMQRTLWDNWVAGLKNADASEMGSAWQQYGEEFTAALRESMDKVRAAQQDLMQKVSAKAKK